MQRIPVATHMHAIVSTITYAYPVLKNPIGPVYITHLPTKGCLHKSPQIAAVLTHVTAA